MGKLDSLGLESARHWFDDALAAAASFSASHSADAEKYAGQRRSFYRLVCPMGVAALYYCFYSYKKLHLGEIWTITSLVVFCSVVAHGMTAYPLLKK